MQTENIRKLAVHGPCINFLRIHQFFPSDEEINDPKRNGFIYKYLLINLSTLYYSIGALIHLVNNARRGILYTIGMDVQTIISYHGVSYFALRYLFNLKKLVYLLKQLSDLETFGKPPNFDERLQTLKKLAYGYYFYHMVLVIGTSTSPIFFVKECEENNIILNITEVCGVAPTWLPFNLLDHFSIRLLTLLYQVYCCLFINQTSGYLPYCIWETIEHIKLRFDHAAETMIEAILEKNIILKKKKFGKAVLYHQTVMNMGKLANECFSPCCLLHFAMSAPIIGVCGYKALSEFSLDATVLFIGWSFSTYVVCLGGQRLMELNSKLGNTIFEAEWIDVGNEMKKDLALVILRSQTPIRLRAGPFGAMGYATYVMIFKGAYSFITLLKTLLD